ncbi:AbrB family transcriptional regulator [Halorubrum sp. Ib24]|uniref:AbrB/MazE/SpoVT family DNA-binding domain-containing protein n=1 Tax=Halorubrum sp. Ib24 TaxID=1383850 RepID=UPI000B9878D6|nr:AbrB/MazE/SpoVT family DNA-binding domain-containing protein [Halorubrum sp. Ib24]OYR39825.1 AbrB family transcriptional regulator [Halorubrum sp. Ib24]
METRKLQEVGGGTFTVSIPKGWAKSHGFEVGMELRLYTHRDGSILVRSSAADADRLGEATIDIGDDADTDAGGGPEAVRRAVRTAHAVGFETITLRRAEAFSDAERSAARSAVRGLVGTNVLSESDSEITIRHLLDTASVSVRQSVVQLRYAVVSLLRDATEAFVDAADARSRIRDRADEARRSAEMVTRHFSRSLVSHAELDALGVSRPDLFAYYAAARRLEAVADQAVRIAGIGEKLSGPLADEAAADVRPVADDVALAVDDAVTAVLDGDGAASRRARERCDDAAAGIESIDGRLYGGAVPGPVSAAVALSDALARLERAADCARSVTETAAAAAIRDENTRN